MTSYPLFNLSADSHIVFDLGNVRPSTKCNCWSEVGLPIWFDPIIVF